MPAGTQCRKTETTEDHPEEGYYSASELETESKQVRAKSVNIPFTEPHLHGEAFPVRVGTINTVSNPKEISDTILLI